jgi:hypothetical protein
MRAGERRALTAGERAIAQSMFGEALRLERLRITQAPRLGFGAMAPFGRTIVFSNWIAARDFAEAPLGEQGWFVHELTHCWQAQRGLVPAYAKLGALGRRAYDYSLAPDKPLHRYNIEQQGEIARHLFLARRGGAQPNLRALEAIWPLGA